MFTKKLIQAPLAGYSCAPFRVLAHRWGGPDFCCTEMLSSLNICASLDQEKRYRYKSPEEGRLCAQLAGDNPEVLAIAAQRVVEWGADFVDLNCGCPQPKIRKKNFGSRLLENSTHLYKVVSAMRQAIHVPLFVKIRVDSDSGDHYNQEVAMAIEEAGADVLTVHGRHWSQDYDTPVIYHDIAIIKDTIKIPVIGNGDVEDAISAKKMFAETGCDAIMIARASVGQPWIFEKIYQELQGMVYSSPDLQTIGDIFLEHVRGLIDLEGESNAILQARKLGKYYARSHIQSPEYFKQITAVSQYQEFEFIVKKFFIN